MVWPVIAKIGAAVVGKGGAAAAGGAAKGGGAAAGAAKGGGASKGMLTSMMNQTTDSSNPAHGKFSRGSGGGSNSTPSNRPMRQKNLDNMKAAFDKLKKPMG